MNGQALFTLLPEISLTLGIACYLFIELWGKEKNLLYLISIGILLVALEGVIASSYLLPLWEGTIFHGTFIFDKLSLYLKGICIAGMMLIALLSANYLREDPNEGEYYLFLLLSTLSMCLISSAYDLLSLYISLEFLSISCYILSAYAKKEPKSGEAGIKYFLFGAVISAVMLYGISLLYGITGYTFFPALSFGIWGKERIVKIALAMFLAGFGFKIAMVPLHLWVPDVFQGAPTPVSALLSVLPKFAAFLALFRVLKGIYPADWLMVIAILSAFTMTLGNLIAIHQRNVKRLLGYSTIAHAGYILIALASSRSYWGTFSLFFYFLPYLFANIGAFAVTSAIYLSEGKEDLEDFAGLAHRSPLCAVAMALSLLSLIGIPGTGGFVGKFFIFAGALKANMAWLALLLLANSVVSAFYYLKIVREMFIASGRQPIPLNEPLTLKVAIGLCLAFTLLLMFLPQPFISLVQASLPNF